MTYLWILLAVVLIVGPIFSLLPSRRQKEQMAIRRRAMAAGIGVELTRIEDPDPDPEKYRLASGRKTERVLSVVAYKIQRNRPADWRKVPKLYWCLLKGPGEDESLLPPWAWHGTELKEFDPAFIEFLQGALKELPADVVKLEERNWVINLYWHEKGARGSAQEKDFHTAIERVDGVVSFMKALAERPAHVPLEDDPGDTDSPDEGTV